MVKGKAAEEDSWQLFSGHWRESTVTVIILLCWGAIGELHRLVETERFYYIKLTAGFQPVFCYLIAPVNQYFF